MNRAGAAISGSLAVRPRSPQSSRMSQPRKPGIWRWRSALLGGDPREHLLGDRLGVGEPRVGRLHDVLEIGPGVGKGVLAVVDLAALKLRARVVGLARDRLAERLDRLV